MQRSRKFPNILFCRPERVFRNWHILLTCAWLSLPLTLWLRRVSRSSCSDFPGFERGCRCSWWSAQLSARRQRRFSNARWRNDQCAAVGPVQLARFSTRMGLLGAGGIVSPSVHRMSWTGGRSSGISVEHYNRFISKNRLRYHWSMRELKVQMTNVHAVKIDATGVLRTCSCASRVVIFSKVSSDRQAILLDALFVDVRDSIGEFSCSIRVGGGCNGVASSGEGKLLSAFGIPNLIVPIPPPSPASIQCVLSSERPACFDVSNPHHDLNSQTHTPMSK